MTGYIWATTWLAPLLLLTVRAFPLTALALPLVASADLRPRIPIAMELLIENAAGLEVASIPDDQEITLVVVITNISGQDLRIRFPNACGGASFYVMDSEYKEVLWTNMRACLAVEMHSSLKAGGSHRFEVRWNRERANGEPVSPGTYRVVAVYSGTVEDGPWDGFSPHAVGSIKIRERAE